MFAAHLGRANVDLRGMVLVEAVEQDGATLEQADLCLAVLAVHVEDVNGVHARRIEGTLQCGGHSPRCQ